MNRTVLSTALLLLLTAGTAHATGTAPADIGWSTANSVATGDQDNSAVSAVRGGYTAVVWEDDRDEAAQEDSVHSEVFLRLYQDGGSKYEKKLSAGGTGNWRHVRPDVALHENGSAVVVWAEDPDANGFYNIAVRVVRADGTVTGSTTANASAAGQQLDPAVAVDPDTGGFAVVWEDKQSTTMPTVRVAGFASPTSKTYEVQVHADGGTHQRPDVAMGAAGNAVVVWDEDGDGNGLFNVGRKVFTATGGVKVPQGVANAASAGQQRHPSVAANFNGDFAVAWETDHTGTSQVAARSFSSTGAAQSTTDTVLPGMDPQVGIDDQLGVVVAWVDQSNVYAQGLNPDGTVTGRLPRLLTDQTTTGRQDEPALGVDPWGLVTVTYTDDNDGNLFDQIYLGTGLVNSTW